MLVCKMFLEFYYSAKPKNLPFALLVAAAITLLAFGPFPSQWELFLWKLFEMLTYFNTGRFLYISMYVLFYVVMY